MSRIDSDRLDSEETMTPEVRAFIDRVVVPALLQRLMLDRADRPEAA
jgi:hypothetical protein